MVKKQTRVIPLKFEYTNWQSEVAIRRVQPVKLWYGKTQWHPKEQWFLKALDLEKNEERNFAVKDIIKFL
ncbi:hypothetical protein A3A76_00770 [Candidatus Woesebacteria bacterium RIFCSPLOWO2_01_FULL_39_23]|uniref:WYL domain-containing protein n=1 Tax=Candidatus Woesebacteria bacterium RIFCSPHIGHO2_01_FULL_40_22 TaxID=1802499 RepID=A0A1F7YHH9_9BACT|nr:MAG: hypothetical protein A2141_05415 [Candidatus Woesebacteria bacterium RBG_16_40_11]OGM26777.1 MAG: hypothetical protein A2628_04445 [Candidatus Woesebacteria bacterium RIFCSPHIGHO2_01_FULL_40_22]OGM63073.1 MAG: hypothetical protein A3A76_00770 [Candidatus Woesebacteria bacterium RIFCSPLOWO2_01_FULL_39_23]